MAKVDFHDKMNRSLRLLLGLRHLEVRSALAPYNLTPKVMAEGWELLEQAGMMRVLTHEDVKETETYPPAPRAMKELDDFQKLWFPIARGVLQAKFPKIGAAFFAGLTQERGAATPLVVLSFLDRLDALAKGDPGFAPDGPKARALLAERGLTQEVQAGAAVALEAWGQVYCQAEETTRALRAEEVATERLWTFYLEWSAIAAHVITNRAHLRWLGLESRARKRGKSVDSA